MDRNFWSNRFWYIFLILTTLSIIFNIVRKSENWKKTIALYFSIVGFTFLVEWFLLVIFKGYSYHPMMMKEPFEDCMMGNVISQTLIASTALLIGTYELKFLWFIFFSLFLSLIEILFLKLGIYKHYWYSTWFTFFGLIIYFGIVKKWCKSIFCSSHVLVRHIALLLSVFSVYSPCVEWPLHIYGIYLFKVKLLSEPIRNHINDYVVYIFFIVNFILLVYKANFHYIWKILLLSIIYFFNYLLVQLDVLYIRTNWMFIYSTIVTVINYGLIILFDKMFGFHYKKSKMI